MFMNLRALTIALVVLWLAACETTTFTSTWKDPNTPTLDPVGKKVAAVFVSRDEAKRRAGETLLANDISRHGAEGVPAYSLVPDALRGDGEKARAALKDAGASAAVVMRVVGKDQQVNYTPGTTMPSYYGGFGPYWGYGWGAAYSPGYVTTDTIISVETLIYSLTQDKLLWASTSRTTNPGNLDQLVTEVAEATAKEMARQGMLPKK